VVVPRFVGSSVFPSFFLIVVVVCYTSRLLFA
jgi:hypothetical protein